MEQVQEPRKLLRLPDVEGRVGLKKTVIYGLIKRGDFPAPIELTPKARAWDSEAVARWIEEKVRAANDPKPK